MKTKFLQRYRLVSVQVDPPSARDIARAKAFRQGQADRKAGKGLLSADGSYLDGWHSPEKTLPPSINRDQQDAFGPF